MSKIKVIDRGWDKIKKDFKNTERQGMVKVGVQAGSKLKPSAKGSKPKKQADMVLIASVNEFGAPSKNIPARSFLRSTIKENEDRFARITAKEWAKVLAGRSTIRKGLDRIGQDAENKIKRKVITLQKPGLKLATILKKKSKNPLVDTGQLVQSIRYVIQK